MASEFDEGLLTGLLIGEGHFGGDGRQPQVTLRMHERHEPLFRWLERTYPGGRLYGPYEHSGRRYYQWMVRGAYLREELLPLLWRRLSPTLDRYAYTRLKAMSERYARQLRIHDRSSSASSGEDEAAIEPTTRDREEAQEGGPDADLAPGPSGSRAARIFAALRAADTTPEHGND